MLDGEPRDNGSVETEHRPVKHGGGNEGDALTYQESSNASHNARMPVDRNAPYYNMNHMYRGMAIIFNHEHSDIHCLKSHSGTNEDSDNLANVLRSLGFRVTTLNNLKSKDVIKCVQQTADMDHVDFDCLLIAVLTHGELGMLYAIHTSKKNLWHYFTGDRCPTLAGKPKMFFIQACQGDKLDGGDNLQNYTETDVSLCASYKIPVHADFLIVFATVPGCYSWKH